MWQHPKLAPIFTDRGASRQQTLSDVIAELGELGEWTLSGHDENGAEQDVVCTLRLRCDPMNMLIGSGQSPELAALRALMEGHHQLERITRSTADHFQSFLRDEE